MWLEMLTVKHCAEGRQGPILWPIASGGGMMTFCLCVQCLLKSSLPGPFPIFIIEE